MVGFRVVVLALAVTTLSSLQGCGGSGGGDTIDAARRYLAERNKPAALVSLKAALKRQPESAEVRFLLGKTLLETGEPVQAEVELRKALELGHSEGDVIPQLVKALTAIGRAEEATRRFGAMRLQDKRAMAELQTGLAAAWGMQGRSDNMRTAIDEALANDPLHATANVVKATFLVQDGKADASTALLDEVLKRDPSFPSALFYKGLLLRHLKKDIPGAIASQREALKYEPTLMPAHAELLSIYFEAKDKTALRAQLADMQKVLPKNMATALFKAQAEYLDNNLRGARELVQQLLKAKEADPRVLLLAAEIEYRSGALTLAETYLTRALNADPKLASARPLLAQIQVRLGQTDKALRTLQPVLEGPTPTAAALSVAAEASLHAGRPAQAQTYFERAAKLNPDDPRVRTAIALNRMAMGEVSAGVSDLERVAASDAGTFADLALIATLLRRQEMAGALAAIDKLEAKDAKSPLAPYLRGQIQLTRKDKAAAKVSFMKSLTVDANYFPAARALGSLDLAAGDLGGAKKHFEAMLAKDPGNFRAMLALADLKSRGREPEEQVVALLLDAVKRNPTELDARVALLEYYLATGNYQQAVSAGQDALVQFPNHPGILDGLGRGQLGTKEYQQAISTFRRVASLVPNSPAAHLRLADAHAARNERNAAVASLQRALDISPNMVPAQARQIEFLVQEKRLKEALVIARKVQQTRPKEATGYLLEAGINIEGKQWDQAAAALQTSLTRQPTTAGAMRLHDVLLEQGKASEASRFAAEWQTRYPKDLVFLFHMGTVASRAGDWPRAEGIYRQVLASDPNHTTSNNNLAWALIHQKKPGALAFAEKAVQRAPKVPAVLDTLAAALSDAGQDHKALEIQRKVVAQAPELMEARLNLARIALKTGDKALARSELEKLAYEGAKFANQEEVSRLLRTLN